MTYATRAAFLDPRHRRVLVAAADADREAAAQRLSVRNDVGLDAIRGLGALRVDAEAGIHLVEDQEHISVGADLAQLLAATPGSPACAPTLRLLFLSTRSDGGEALRWKHWSGLTRTAAISDERAG